MRPNSETRDAPPEGWLAWSRTRSGADTALPRLRILGHADLSRIGWVSVPGAIPSGDEWLTLGRNEPHFAGVGPVPPRPVEDPHVSREQLRIRYRPDLGRFEVDPVRAARRPIVRVDLDLASAQRESPLASSGSLITGPALLAPGMCIAIGDRVLFGLEVAGFRPPTVDRLGLIGESPALWALRDEIRSVAQFGRSALVIGPTGAGKELVARALHNQSARAQGPFVPVNCAALPETLAESVLFGHKKGAFTGADADGKGLFRAAEGGTLFFDELGELPLVLQAKLLRVLQDGVVVPVGAHEGRKIDVRVVAATHRDLSAFVKDGKLREDLYHRMSAHVLRVPSLAERRLDVPELFVHMLSRVRAEHESLAWMWSAGQEWRPPLPVGFLVELMGREWRGNVRELQNFAERTARVNLHPGAFQAPEMVESSPNLAPAPPPPSEPAEAPSEAPLSRGEEVAMRVASETLGVAKKTLRKLLAPGVLGALAAEADKLGFDEAKRASQLRAAAAEALLTMLEARDFNQSSVAAALGTSRTTLIKLMDDLRLPRATDLGAEEIASARAQAGGDLDAAARILRVSASALKKRVTLLSLKEQG